MMLPCGYECRVRRSQVKAVAQAAVIAGKGTAVSAGFERSWIQGTRGVVSAPG